MEKEIGYKGEINDYEKMNVWMKKKVIKKMKDRGGKMNDGL